MKEGDRLVSVPTDGPGMTDHPRMGAPVASDFDLSLRVLSLAVPEQADKAAVERYFEAKAKLAEITDAVKTVTRNLREEISGLEKIVIPFITEGCEEYTYDGARVTVHTTNRKAGLSIKSITKAAAEFFDDEAEAMRFVDELDEGRKVTQVQTLHLSSVKKRAADEGAVEA